MDNCKIKITVYDNSNKELGSSRYIDYIEFKNANKDMLTNEANGIIKKLDDKEDRDNNPHHYSNRID